MQIAMQLLAAAVLFAVVPAASVQRPLRGTRHVEVALISADPPGFGRTFAMKNVSAHWRAEHPEEMMARGGQAPETYTSAVGVEFAPMSSLMWCLCVLTAHFFILSAVLATARLAAQLRGQPAEDVDAAEDDEASETEPAEPASDRVLRILESAEGTLNFAPVLCILFLAAQLQALEASGGRSDPPPWMRHCMVVATGALIAQTVAALLVPAVTGEDRHEVFDKELSRTSWAPGLLGGTQAMWAKGLCAALILALYGACVAICVGLLTLYGGPLELFAERSVSPAVSCTVNLTLQFFVVHLLLTIARARDVAQGSRKKNKFFEVMQLAALTVFFVPMLSVLFIAARVRARHVDPHGGQPQVWAQGAFYFCTYGVLLQTVLTVLPAMPCCGGLVDAKRGTDKMEPDIEFELVGVENKLVRICVKLLRYVPNCLVCGGFVTVVVSILTIRSSSGPTPPLAATHVCVVVLALQYFLVYFPLWVAISVRNVTHGHVHGGKGTRIGVMVEMLWAASATVRFCPMLAVLFLSLRIRAQQITRNVGTPQGWAQDAMIVCTAAVVAQLVMCLIVGCQTGGAPDVDEDGHTRVSQDSQWRFAPSDGKSQRLREEASPDALLTEYEAVRSGEVLHVSEEVVEDGITYLKLADGRGWLLDPDPGSGGGPACTPEARRAGPVLAKVAVAMQALSFLALFGGAVTVCVALWVITPESAGGRGAVLSAL